MRIIFKTCFLILCFLFSISELDGKCPKALPVTRGNGISPCSGKLIHTGKITTRKSSGNKKKNRKLQRENIKLKDSDYRESDFRGLYSLQELHDIEKRLLNRGTSLSRSEQNRLKRDIRSLHSEILSEIRDIKNFPHLNELGNLHEYAERIHSSGEPRDFRNLTKKQILNRLQNEQYEALKRYTDFKVTDRKYRRLNED